MSEICVAHLVRKKNGIAPFKRFLDSYREHAAGIEHDFLMIFKGFSGQSELEEYFASLSGLAFRTFFTSDEGFDIQPYLNVARQFDYSYFCFLNSFSVILDRDWLAKMYGHINREEVGLVGATGSSESHYTNQQRALRLTSYAQQAVGNILKLHRPQTFGSYLAQKRLLAQLKADFDPFPNHHVRTNAFMISREVLLKLKVGAINNKMDAMKFESGKAGLTKQVIAMDLQALVVGRDGKAYGKDQWYESRTFRSSEQQNLLVADNRTRQYHEADPGLKGRLSEYSWGKKRP